MVPMESGSKFSRKFQRTLEQKVLKGSAAGAADGSRSFLRKLEQNVPEVSGEGVVPKGFP